MVIYSGFYVKASSTVQQPLYKIHSIWVLAVLNDGIVLLQEILMHIHRNAAEIIIIELQ